jgi:hypothetical protein
VANLILGQFYSSDGRVEKPQPRIIVKSYETEILGAAHTEFLSGLQKTDCHKVIGDKHGVWTMR